MTSRTRFLQRRGRSLSSSSSSDGESDDSPAMPSSLSRLPHANTLDRRPAGWQSTPTLVTRGDGVNNSDTGRGIARHPPRHHSQGIIASHSSAQPAPAYNGQTWVDFLRESGVEDTTPHGRDRERPNPFHSRVASSSTGPSAVPNRYTRSTEATSTMSRTSSARKRSLTASEHQARRSSSTRQRQGNPGSSAADPIVLASSPSRPTPPSRSGHASPAQRDTDIVLPPWQPDSEVNYCRVCGSQFTFFYRKHHCRKCGRVVCSACSPHRITIPRQFIVHPPSEVPAGISIMDLTRDEDDDSNPGSPVHANNPALGGGEEVRVCNPCVPDPNYAPPPPYSISPPIVPSSIPGRVRDLPYSPPASRGFNPTPGFGRPLPSPHAGSPFGQTGPGINTSLSLQVNAQGWAQPRYHPGAGAFPMPPPPRPSAHEHIHDEHAHRRPSVRPPHRPFSDRLDEARRDARARSSTTSHASLHARPSIASPIPQPPPQPRRQIAEEDECPICGNELPPKGPSNDSSARDDHVMTCIAMYSSSLPPPPAAIPSTSLPTQSSMMGMPEAGAGSSNRLSLNARGLFPYTATEKDCLDDEGKEAECVICFEEFEVGDRLARLACWCRFHEKCIREWWDHKGRGACPTHQQGL